MNNVDFLQTYSEIAVAIIGFSGVVVALKGNSASEGEKITLSMLILFLGRQPSHWVLFHKFFLKLKSLEQ